MNYVNDAKMFTFIFKIHVYKRMFVSKIFLFAAIYLRLGYTDHKVISQLNTIY